MWNGLHRPEEQGKRWRVLTKLSEGCAAVSQAIWSLSSLERENRMKVLPSHFKILFW